MQMDLAVKNAQFAGLLWAEQHGWYREVGLDVTIRKATNGLDVARAVSRSHNTVGSIESGLLLSALAEGCPVTAIGTMFQASPLCLISPASLKIRAPRDLTGKRIGIHGDGQEALDTVLASSGLNRRQMTITETSYGNDALIAGKFDAVQGYLVDEFVLLKTQGHDVTALPLHRFGHIAYSQVYFVSPEFLKNHRAELIRFLSVSNRGWRAAMQNKPTATRMILEKYEPGLGYEYQLKSLQEIQPLLWAESSRTAAMRPATWKANVASFLHSRPEATLPSMKVWADFAVADEAQP
jgi:ABC-type nitrate/sulfonate/bicarbonate transport system substrate-binding protein